VQARPLGPFRVAEVGLGAGPLGSDVIDDAAVERLRVDSPHPQHP